MSIKKITISMVWLLAILNIVDMILTGFGLHNGLFDEKNPLMKSLWLISPIYFYTVKSLLSICIILILQLGLRKITPSIFTAGMASVAVILYLGIMFLHGIAYHFTVFQ